MNLPEAHWAMRCREIASAIFADFGGAEKLPEARKQLVWRFAAAAVLAEQMEAQLAHGKRIDIKPHALLTSTLVRIAQCIGIDHQSKNTAPNLREYLAAKTHEMESVE
jgi:hypothetical protein